MSDLAFKGAVESMLRSAGCRITDAGQVTLSVEDFATLLSQHNLAVIQQFVRLQRKAGIQTIHYATIQEPGSFAWLVDRMAEFELLLEKDKPQAQRQLQEQVVDIRPVVDGRLYSLCNLHRSLADYGFLPEAEPAVGS